MSTLALSRPTRTVEELAASISVSKTVARRLLAEWEVPRIVERDANGRYALTPAALAAFARPLEDARPQDPEPDDGSWRRELLDADELPVRCVSCGGLLPASVRQRRGRACSTSCRNEVRRQARRVARQQQAAHETARVGMDTRVGTSSSARDEDGGEVEAQPGGGVGSRESRLSPVPVSLESSYLNRHPVPEITSSESHEERSRAAQP